MIMVLLGGLVHHKDGKFNMLTKKQVKTINVASSFLANCLQFAPNVRQLKVIK
jgi:hypothetical protein